MRFFKQIFNFYINSSIHVGLSCYALVRMTQYMFHISEGDIVANFAFFGTIVGYNFVKYDALARAKKIQMRSELKVIALFSFFALFPVIYYFFQLQRITQLAAVVFLSITLLYTFSFFPNKKNARNWAGVKIYIVALCWVGVTLGLPILDSGILITSDFYLKCLQRFFLIFVLILIFEIIDLANDDPHLKTVPQQIGVKRTKTLGLLLLIPFYLLEFFTSNLDKNQLIVNLILVLMIALFLIFANEKRSKYYTSFWIESVPIVWWLLLLLF
ncbi:UbiA prenyltransferase family protein [Flavobacterium caseinilyticum]|uniref:Prenyltransferase n=1 Tax=Flavobacterium caseinilyticum TaxID=2541732 RepID=A0A4R5AVW8_9FLAO|nr:hypothetical protein [Flavobacterium caseinilyticum]TDD75856.1 hypothetical protein E0F89_09850 [Flavobacterium caseinilyticum]